MSISFAGVLCFWEGCPFHMGVVFIGGVSHFLGVFFIGMGYGVLPATPPHREQRSCDQLLPYTRSKVMIKCFISFLRLSIQY